MHRVEGLRGFLFTVIPGILNLALVGSVSAQSNQGSRVLEEIVVTAERRDQSLQSLAITASAMSGDSLNANQFAMIDDLVRATPGLTVNSAGVAKSINIRGIGKNVDAPGVSPGVAYYVDGVPIVNNIFLDTSFFDLSRVEILRGPQGTLVGMNSTGGAILIVSNDPNPEQSEGMIEASYGDYDHGRLRGMWNLPIGESLGFRVAGEYEERDSFFDNKGPADGEPGDLERLSLRAAFGGSFTDSVELFLRGEYMDTETDGWTGKVVPGDPGAFPYTIFPLFSPDDEFDLGRDVETKDDYDYYRISANLSININDTMEFRSITGYQDGDRNIIVDGDATAFPGALVTIDISEETISQEFNLISTTDGPYNWVLGAFYLDLETTGFVEPLFLPAGGVPLSQVFGNSTTENWGVFGQITYHVTDRTNLTVGLRYNDQEASNPGGKVQLFDPPGVPGPLVPESLLNAEDDEVTGKVTLDHQFTDDHFGFMTVSKGFKGGGTNSAPLPPFAPETVWNYELGLKSDFFDGQMRSQFAVFFMDYDDLQRNAYNPSTPELSGVSNLDSAEVYGAELQVQGQFGGFGFDMAVGYTKSEIGDVALIDDRYDTSTLVDLSDNSLNFNPEWTFSLGIDYAAQFKNGLLLTPRARYSYTDSQWSNEFQVRPTDYIDSYSLVDASVRLEMEGASWYAVLYGTNLLDEDWISAKSTYSPDPGRVEYAGAPRQYGVRLGYNF